MVRCADFYEKWKKDPNWCQKSPDTVNQIDHYLGLVGELENLGVETAAIYKKFPEGVAREILKIKDEIVRASVIGNTAGMIKRGDRVSSADVKVWAGIEDAPKKITPSTALPDPTIVGNRSPDIGVKTESAPSIPDISDLPPLSPDAPMSERLKRDAELLTRFQKDDTGFARANGEPSPAISPSVQAFPRISKANPRTLTIAFDIEEWDTLKQIQRENMADGFENAVIWAVKQIGERVGA